MNENFESVTVKVRDEAKETERDFTCERELLISEMPYFRDYLIRNGEFIKDVEILVHCDIKIFEWLMRYVKRWSDPGNYQDCYLSVSNVLALLISSDFLKMESLSSKCLTYFCEHINAIIASPFSLDCLNENLLERVVLYLSTEEADRIKDKKDKIKSKIFFKKIEKLFNKDFSSVDCPENAYGLFRCTICDRILTRSTAIHVPCLPYRFIVSRTGKIIPVHSTLSIKTSNTKFTSNSIQGNFHSFTNVTNNLQDQNGAQNLINSFRPLSHASPLNFSSRSNTTTALLLSPSNTTNISSTLNDLNNPPLSLSSSSTTNFSATDLLSSWFVQLGNWRLVYWKLWATINLQSCCRCGRKFSIIELGDGCFYHPDKPLITKSDSINEIDLKYQKYSHNKESDLTTNKLNNTSVVQNLNPYLIVNNTSDEIQLNKQSINEITKLYTNSELKYPCCGFSVPIFDPFPIQTGCHRNEHIIDSNQQDIVTKLTLQYHDLIVSWAPKRSFNPNNAPGLMTVSGHPYPMSDKNQIPSAIELLRTAPWFTLLDCLDRDELEDDKESQKEMIKVGRETVLPIYETISDHNLLTKYDGDNCNINDNVNIQLVPNIHPTNLLIDTSNEKIWDSTKCYRINQDCQRQEDLRRMQKMSEFLISQRDQTSTSLDRKVNKESQYPGGIYSRLDLQWRSQFGGLTASKFPITHLSRKFKHPPSTQPFR